MKKIVAALLCVLMCLSAWALAEGVDAQSIQLTGVGNARELGGYASADGRTVRHGVLLRTAALGNATGDDIQRLLDVYHLSVVIDLRSSFETESAPDPEIAGVKNLNIHILDEAAMPAPQSSQDETGESPESSDKMSRLRAAVEAGIISDQMYVDFLSTDVGKSGYSQLFEELLALPEGEALLFHCSQGKDRTGLAAMLILTALGVDEDTIMSDYLLTNTYNAELIEQERQMLAAEGIEGETLDLYMTALDGVCPQMMQNALDWMKENYGSVEGYITGALGVTDAQLEALKDKFLEG